jgi:hypothetical protein
VQAKAKDAKGGAEEDKKKLDIAKKRLAAQGGSAKGRGTDYNNTMVVGVRVRPINKKEALDDPFEAQGLSAVRVIER